MSLPTFLAFCGLVSFSSLSPPFFPPSFSTIFSYSLPPSPSFSFTLFHGLLALILLHTQIEAHTQGRMIKMFREKYGWSREKAEAWETAKRQDHKSVFCLKRNSERAATRWGELAQHRHRSAAALDDSPVLPSLRPLVSCRLQIQSLSLDDSRFKGNYKTGLRVCVVSFFGFRKKCCEMKGRREQT